MARAKPVANEFARREAVATQALSEDATGCWLEHDRECLLEWGYVCTCLSTAWFSARRNVAAVGRDLVPQVFPRH